MRLGSKHIDHLVYGVPDLEKAISELELLLGVRAIEGGRHKTKGTRNALINLGSKCYLELLAIDRDSNVVRPRWMGIDHLTSAKCLRWSLQTQAIEQDADLLSTYDPQLAKIDEGQRWTPDNKLLKWQMTLPLASPEVELMPFLIDWSQSAQHPADNLPEQCRLRCLDLSTPHPSKAQIVLNKFCGIGEIIIGFSNETKIIATIESPHGIVKL